MTSMLVTSRLCTTLVVCALIGLGGSVNFGTGSSRLEENAADFNKIVEDTE